ncbi:MAG: hypothetical protein HC822_00325 [Oscillochloris sp.]|nr:hypothetical protein [Oscillochloris sp.]
MNRFLNRYLRTQSRGQSAVLVALILPFLMGFTLLVVEVAERWLEVAMVEDALQQATRSTVQHFNYAALAQGDDRLASHTECRAVTARQASDCKAILNIAHTILVTNLTGVRGMNESHAALADRVRWTVLPNGGTCSFSSNAIVPVTETTPLICAEVRPQMRGIVGWGVYTPLIVAADTLDPLP